MAPRPKILVVDDEDRNLRLMEALLTPMGYEVILAANGEQALEKAVSASPDVILLDVMMPGLNGFEVAERLRRDEATRLVPIVMVTVLKEVNDRVRALDAGADDFLTKPVDRLEVRARLRSLVKVKAYNDHMRDYQKELEAEVTRRTEDLRKALERVKVASLDTIFRLARAAEYKDQDTGAHLQRMSRFSWAVARRLGLPRAEAEDIQYAAPMHDIGKIGIPDRILLKPGKLDPDEWEIMRQHSTIGASILEGSDIPFIQLAERVARSHHEKWDGTGYPASLAGERIPLPARIVAVADVFDAVTCHRPYRKNPMPVPEALDLIRKGRGSHFDPAVVDAFFAVQDEVLAIKDQFRDGDESRFLLMANRAEAKPPAPA